MLRNKIIVIAGGTGFMGVEMCSYFGKENKIIILTRNIPNAQNNRNSQTYNEASKNVQYIEWDAKNIGAWANFLEGCDVLINLTGRTVNCRYTKKNKAAILNSRIDATNILNKAVNKLIKKPTLWINASSATIYNSSYTKPNDEYVDNFATNFSVDVCRKWEAAFFKSEHIAVRKVALRMAITLGSGGVLIPYFNLLKYGLGGTQGSGIQMFSWIHIEDLCRMIEWTYTNENIHGVLNAASPNPVTNKELMTTFRKLCGTKFGFPIYIWMLKLGAKLIGSEVELVLKSRNVIPTKAIQNGFTFKYPILKNALSEIIEKTPKKQYKLLA